MGKLKFYTTMVLCLCTVAIGSTIEFYNGLSTTGKTVEQAHTSIFKNDDNTVKSDYVFNSLNTLVSNK